MTNEFVRLRYRNSKFQDWTYTNHNYSKSGEYHILRDMQNLRNRYRYVEVHRRPANIGETVYLT